MATRKVKKQATELDFLQVVGAVALGAALAWFMKSLSENNPSAKARDLQNAQSDLALGAKLVTM